MEWNPATDKYLDVNYTRSNVMMGKAAAKEALQAEAGLDIDPRRPLFGYIGRLEEQKGVDILLKVCHRRAALDWLICCLQYSSAYCVVLLRHMSVCTVLSWCTSAHQLLHIYLHHSVDHGIHAQGSMQALPKVLQRSRAQVVILGTGKAALEKEVEGLDKKFPNCKGIAKFSTPLAHMITAGADFLMVRSTVLHSWHVVTSDAA